MDDVLRQFLGRDAGPLVQFIKYGICGGIATAVHIVIFHLLAWRAFPALQDKDPMVRVFKLTVPPLDDRTRSRNSMIDNGLTFLVSNLSAYVLNILWVFHAGRYPWYIELALFYAVSGVSMVIGTALMGVLIKRLGMRTTYAFSSNVVVSVLINYAMRKFVIFQG